ncbi:MAG TPA: hypothetical protein VGL63_07365 [Streptosporangiaceae bacterium]
MSVSQSVQNLLNTVAHSLPKIGVFLVVLVIGWFVATIIKRAVQALLQRLNFERVAERGAIGQALGSRGYTATSLLARIVYYAVLLVTLQLAFGVFGPNPVSAMINGMVSWLPKAVVAIVLVIVASAIAKVVKDLVGAALGGLSYGRFVASTAAIVIIALGVIAALNQVGIAGAVTQPVLIAVLATAGAILAIGVGGGMVRPMEQRWERMLTAAERETSGQLAAYQRGRQDALASPGMISRQEQVYASHDSGAYANYDPGVYAGPGMPPPPDPMRSPMPPMPQGQAGPGGPGGPGGSQGGPQGPGGPVPWHHGTHGGQ